MLVWCGIKTIRLLGGFLLSHRVHHASSCQFTYECQYYQCQFLNIEISNMWSISINDFPISGVSIFGQWWVYPLIIEYINWSLCINMWSISTENYWICRPFCFCHPQKNVSDFETFWPEPLGKLEIFGVGISTHRTWTGCESYLGASIQVMVHGHVDILRLWVANWLTWGSSWALEKKHVKLSKTRDPMAFYCLVNKCYILGFNRDSHHEH